MLKGNGSKNSSNSDRHNDFESASRSASVKDRSSNRLDVVSRSIWEFSRDYKSGDFKYAVLDRQNVFGDGEQRLNDHA